MREKCELVLVFVRAVAWNEQTALSIVWSRWPEVLVRWVFCLNRSEASSVFGRKQSPAWQDIYTIIHDIYAMMI